MANRRMSPNYYAYLSRVQDERAVDRFCYDLPDNFFAVLIANDSSFVGLILSDEAYGAAATPDEIVLSRSDVLDHPLTRESNTRIGALTASYQAYIGSLLTEVSREVS
jgi:hypothetical protein